jgi:hypothetical protein
MKSRCNIKVTDDNKLQLSFSQQLTPRIGENVSFQPNRLEIFGPEGVINASPKEQKLEPTITPKSRELKDMSSDELRSILSEALQDGRIEELRIRTKNNELLIIKNETDFKKK